MISTMYNFVQSTVEMSLLGCVEIASVVMIVYYLYAKTRAVTIVAGLFPNLNLNINYRSSLDKFNNMGNELLVTFRKGGEVGVKGPSYNHHGNRMQIDSPSVLAPGVGTRNMLEITPLAGQTRPNSLLNYFNWTKVFPHIAQNLHLKKYKYIDASKLVEKDPTLKRAIIQATEQVIREQRILWLHAERDNPAGKSEERPEINYELIEESQERRAKQILRNMRSTLNNFLLTLTSYLLYKLLPCFLSGVVTHTKQIEMLKAASERAPGIPLIFMPLHKSHLDYIMVTWTLANHGIRSPLVAAGNNLQIPIFGGLLRGLGAFFIKRKIDPVAGKKDILYRAVLQLYLQHSLKAGHNVEFFIEGGRTRTGKPCMPKGGILSVIVNAYMDNQIPDALLIPVSMNYERLVEGNFVREQKGEKKVPETFRKALAGIWKALKSKYGLMRIDFNEPYSLRELVNSYNQIEVATQGGGCVKIPKPANRSLQQNQSTSSLYGTDVVCEEHRTLIDSISRQVVYDCASATSVMSTNALAFLLLTQFRKGAPLQEIAKGLDQLRSLLIGRRDIGFSGDSAHIVNYAIDLFGSELVTRTQNEQGQVIVRAVPSIDSMIELAYYSNMLVPHFAPEAIVLITFYNLIPAKNDALSTLQGDSDEKAIANCLKSVGVVRRQLVKAAMQSCDVFRYEFIWHKPIDTLECVIENAVDDLILRGFLRTEDISEDNRRAKNLAKHLENDDDIDSLSSIDSEFDPPNLFLSRENTTQQRALCDVLAPFSHTYFGVVQCLYLLADDAETENIFIQHVIKKLTQSVADGNCAYAECISTDSVRNCLKLLEKWSVIEIIYQNDARLLKLPEDESIVNLLGNVVQRFKATVPCYDNGYF